MTVIIKRKRSDSSDDQTHQEIPDFGGISLATMANYLMLLSQGAHHHQQQQQHQHQTTTSSPFVCFDSSSPATTTTSSSDHPSSTHHQHQPRVFECKTCNRQFPSFQALGGHRASHKRPKIHSSDSTTTTNSSDSTTTTTTPAVPTKPKSHECSVCGLEFPIGQALGGHMRRHRAVYADAGTGAASILIPPPPPPSAPLSLSLKLATSGYNTPVSSPHQLTLKNQPAASIASEMLRRTASGRATLCLDLNLTPFENNVDQLGKIAPIYG